MVLELSFGRISFVFPSSYQFIRPHASTLLTLYFSRNDDWSSDRPKEERGYDGPAGMEPDGLIESNWDEVSSKILNIWASVVYIYWKMIFYGFGGELLKLQVFICPLFSNFSRTWCWKNSTFFLCSLSGKIIYFELSENCSYYILYNFNLDDISFMIYHQILNVWLGQILIICQWFNCNVT